MQERKEIREQVRETESRDPDLSKIVTLVIFMLIGIGTFLYYEYSIRPRLLEELIVVEPEHTGTGDIIKDTCSALSLDAVNIEFVYAYKDSAQYREMCRSAILAAVSKYIVTDILQGKVTSDSLYGEVRKRSGGGMVMILIQCSPLIDSLIREKRSE